MDSSNPLKRYSRQTTLAELGTHGQRRLELSRVLVVGAGGLASPSLQYLAGAGTGHIRLIDNDCVAESNLHRQTLFREHDIGTCKCDAAALQLRDLNRHCRIEPIVAQLDSGNVAMHCRDVDLVLDCADSFAVSYTLSAYCHSARLPLISASASGLSGYVGGFCGGAPSLAAVFSELPAQAGNCTTEGVLGPVVGILGALQAQMAIAVLAGIEPNPLGQFVTFDARSLRFGGFHFGGTPEPERTPTFAAPASITAGDCVVDLRAPEEGPLVCPGAQRLSVASVGVAGPYPETGQRLVLCCRTGLRSWQAAKKLDAIWGGDIVLVALGDSFGDP